MKRDMKGQYHFEFSDFNSVKNSLDDSLDSSVETTVENPNQLALGLVPSSDVRSEIRYD